MEGPDRDPWKGPGRPGGKCPRGLEVSLPGDAPRRGECCCLFPRGQLPRVGPALTARERNSIGCSQGVPANPLRTAPARWPGKACEAENSDDGTQSPLILTAETWPERIDLGHTSVCHHQARPLWHQTQVDEIRFQSLQIAAVAHPAVLEDRESLDIEDALVARVTDIGVEATVRSD